MTPYLPELGIKLDLPSNHMYKDLGESEIPTYSVFEYLIKEAYKQSGVYTAGMTVQTRRIKGKVHTVTAYQRVKGIPPHYRKAVRAHEETHVADLTGNLSKVESKYGIRLQGRSKEDKANLAEIAYLDGHYDLEKILYSKENEKGMIVMNSRGPRSISYQKSYHKRILNAYRKQKKKKSKSKAKKK